MATEVQAKWHGGIRTTIKGPVDKVWAISGNFCALDKWLKTIDLCEKIEGEYQKPGCIRYMVGKTFPSADGGKSWAKEKLLSIEEDNYSMTYQILEHNFQLKLSQYISTYKLEDLGGGVVRVDWSFQTDPVENQTEQSTAEYMTSMYTKSLQILEDLVSSPV